MPNPSLALFAIIIIQFFFSFTNKMYQLIQLIHERDVPVRSFRSRMTCTSSFNSFTNEISLSRTQKQIGQWRAYSFKTFNNHMLHCISHSKAIGSRISQSLTGWNSPQCKQLMWKEGFQWTRTIRSPKRFLQKERFVHKRNIISQVWSVAALHVWCIQSVTHLSRRNKATMASNNRPSALYRSADFFLFGFLSAISLSVTLLGCSLSALSSISWVDTPLTADWLQVCFGTRPWLF